MQLKSGVVTVMNTMELAKELVNLLLSLKMNQISW